MKMGVQRKTATSMEDVRRAYLDHFFTASRFELIKTIVNSAVIFTLGWFALIGMIICTLECNLISHLVLDIITWILFGTILLTAVISFMFFVTASIIYIIRM